MVIKKDIKLITNKSILVFLLSNKINEIPENTDIMANILK